MNDINKLYSEWREKAVLDKDLTEELKQIEGKEDILVVVNYQYLS